MADIKISQMTAGTPDENTLFEGSLDGGGGVYNTRSVSASALATLLNTTMQYGGLSTTDDTIVGSINEVAKDHNASDEYDSTQTYVVGDLCIYGNNLYECNTDITTPEAFDSNKWTQTTLDAVIPRDADDIPYSQGVSVADKLDTMAVTSNTLVANTVTYYKTGNIVQLSLVGYSVPANTGSYSTRHIIGYLPAGYRPIVNAYCPYVSSAINTLMVQYTDGEVSIRNTSGNAQDAYASIMFITNG